jgi:hypothetical protein
MQQISRNKLTLTTLIHVSMYNPSQVACLSLFVFALSLSAIMTITSQAPAQASRVPADELYSLPDMSQLHPEELNRLFQEILTSRNTYFRAHPEAVPDPTNQAKREAAQTTTALRAAGRCGIRAFQTRQEWERVRSLHFPVGAVRNASFTQYLDDLKDAVCEMTLVEILYSDMMPGVCPCQPARRWRYCVLVPSRTLRGS